MKNYEIIIKIRMVLMIVEWNGKKEVAKKSGRRLEGWKPKSIILKDFEKKI